jgi:hypothetical protein
MTVTSATGVDLSRIFEFTRHFASLVVLLTSQHELLSELLLIFLLLYRERIVLPIVR